MTRREKDITGQKFGYWTAVRRNGADKHSSPKWDVKCCCGEEGNVLKANLLKGTSKSCGCQQRSLTKKNRTITNILPPGEASMKQLWHAYRRGAISRGLAYEITVEEFGILTKKNCTYCGDPPSSTNKIPSLNGYYTYNGVDRYDNTIGYVFSNCVPCCKRCNYAKRDSTIEEFYEWILRLMVFQQEKMCELLTMITKFPKEKNNEK